MIIGICDNCSTENNFQDLEPFTKVKCHQCGAELVVPKEFGKFQLIDIEEKLPITTTYKGYDTNKKQLLKIVVLNKNIPYFREWFNICKTEAKDLEALTPKGVEEIVEYGELDHTFYAAFKVVEGITFTEIDPNKIGELEYKSVINLFKIVITVLKGLHKINFEHHNICLKNLLIAPDEQIIFLNIYASRIIYKYGIATGATPSISPFYISPERVEKKEEDKKGDIFSLGVSWYYMLTGKYPFYGKNNDEILYSRSKKRHPKSTLYPYRPPKKVDEIRHDIPVEYGELIDEMLMPSPVRRPSAAKILSRLHLIEANIERQKSLEFYSKALTSTGIKIDFSNDLEKAIKNNSLILEYQPIIVLSDLSIIGFEAYLRWPDSPAGALSPVDFIPNKKNKKLNKKLEKWVVNKACEQLKKWQSIGIEGVYITINMSPILLNDQQHCMAINNIIETSGVLESQIELEISNISKFRGEKILPEEYIKLTELVNARVSILELGENILNLLMNTNIKNRKLNSLKIDHKIIDDIKKFPNKQKEFGKLIEFANNIIGITVAEKIETEDEFKLLADISCFAAQGYYFHKPAPPEEIESIIIKS